MIMEDKTMAIRKIREMGDSVLNKQCKEVTEMTKKEALDNLSANLDVF